MTCPQHGDQPLHEQIATVALEVGELIMDVAEMNGRLARIHHKLWHITNDTNPQTVEDAT